MIVIRTEVTAFGTADPHSTLAMFEKLESAGEHPRILSSTQQISFDELRARIAP